MRTTIEITPEQRSKLLALAAMKNEKGFSGFVREALDEYLDRRLNAAEKTDNALRMRGCLDDDDAQEFQESCADLRENWR